LMRECTPDDKDAHKVCAIEIGRISKEYPDAWGALCYLGDATENQHIDFDRWRELATPEQRPLVKSIGPGVQL